MRSPDFWHRDGLLPRLLSPLGALYAAAGRRRRLSVTPNRLGIPVLCVGNLTAGGSGKTPTVLALCARLRARGIDVHLLSRGHGGRLTGPHRVDPARDAAVDVGDEPLLLAAAAPAWISRDRAAGGRAAEAAGAGLVIMDDGFQNPGLAKDLSLLVFDQAVGIGNGRVHPAGPLREPAAEGLARAQGLVVTRTEARPDLSRLPSLPADLPVLTALLSPALPAQRLAGARALAFAGIGRPARFFETCQAVGLQLVGTRAFPDHHRYDPDEIMNLVEQAARADAILLTTSKDRARLPAEARPMVEVLEVELVFDDAERLDALLAPLAPTGAS